MIRVIEKILCSNFIYYHMICSMNYNKAVSDLLLYCTEFSLAVLIDNTVIYHIQDKRHTLVS